jgi:prephenate dehydrogenase
MKYYLLLSGDSEKDSIYETNVLGEESFGTFYPSAGFMILKRIVDQNPDVVESIKIIDEQKNSHTITSFLDKLEQWKIKKA